MPSPFVANRMIAVNHRRHKQFRLANLVQKLLVCNALQGIILACCLSGADLSLMLMGGT